MIKLFNLRKSLPAKIMLGYILIIVLGVSSTIISIAIINKNSRLDNKLSEVYFPSVVLLQEFKTISSEANRMTYNWVYQSNPAEKDTLRKLQSEKYVAFKAKLSGLIGQMDRQDLSDSLTAMMARFDKQVELQTTLMGKLSDDSLYNNDVIVDECITLLDKKIKPGALVFEQSLQRNAIRQNEILNEIRVSKQQSFWYLSALFIGCFVLILGIAIAFSLYSTRNIIQPIKQLKVLMQDLAKGKISDTQVLKTQDEIGQMVTTIEDMLVGLKGKIAFSERIGRGDYTSEFNLLSDEDTMGISLIKMRDNLKHAAEENLQRTWATAGMAKIGELLRQSNLKSEELYSQILQFIVTYMQANQGAFFVVEGDQGTGVRLELQACYAYSRKKYLNLRLEPGEGLVGQCFLERETIYLTEVPEHYVHISSGLGDARPTCVIIVPMKVNEEVYGILELASFKLMANHQREFLEKLSESIASTIATVKGNERTRQLLEESQMQSEMLRAQEEEMRQNMEELNTTQEELSRKEQEYIRRIEELEARLAKLN